MAKMKIAILHSGDLKTVSVGGVDQYIKNIIRYSGDGEITVYGTSPYNQLPLGTPCKRNVYGKRYTYVPIVDDKRHPLSIYYFMNLLKYIRSFQEYDVIFAQRIEYSLPFICCRNREKLVQIIHGSSLYTTMNWRKGKAAVYFFLERLSIRIAQRTLVVLMRDEFGVPYYQKKYSKYKDKIEYTKIPVDTIVFRPMERNKCREIYGIPKDWKIILFNGRVEHHPKRVFLFLDILEKLIQNDHAVHLMVIGDGSDRIDLERKIQQKELGSHYVGIGYVGKRKMLAEYLNCADVNINISMFEGTCTSSLESIACGIPVVSTDVGDINLFVHNGCNGFVIKNSTDKEIIAESVDAIQQLLNSNPKMTSDYLRYDGRSTVDELRKQLSV